MISTVEKVLFLKGVDLFSAIPGEDLSQIAQIADEVEMDAGKNFTEGVPKLPQRRMIVRGRAVVGDDPVDRERRIRQRGGEFRAEARQPRRVIPDRSD